jgi:hypothetical protein
MRKNEKDHKEKVTENREVHKGIVAEKSRKKKKDRKVLRKL